MIVEFERAASHHLASGMALGADFGPPTVVMRQLRASKEHEAAGIAAAIVSGGVWLPIRKGVRPGLCRACGRKEETESHIYWECAKEHLVKFGVAEEVFETHKGKWQRRCGRSDWQMSREHQGEMQLKNHTGVEGLCCEAGSLSPVRSQTMLTFTLAT